MNSLDVTYQLVTPAFLEGLTTKKQYLRLRESSFKGLIRFWWRALAYHHYGPDIKQIHKKESDIFGSTKSRSSVLFLPIDTRGMSCSDSSYDRFNKAGISYLGYGLLPPSGKNIPYIDAPFSFTVRMISPKDFDALLVNALKVLGLIGGIGRKSRRGFGSISIVDIKMNQEVIWQAPHTLEDYGKTLRDILPDPELTMDLPSYTAFGRNTAIYFLEQSHQNDDVFPLWDAVGSQFQRYRSFGRKGMVGQHPAEKNFQDDHDLILHADQTVSRAPRRSIFGLPQNYRFSGGNTLTVKPRRASPLMFHFHRFNSGAQLAFASVFPAQFLDKSEPVIRVNGVEVSGLIEEYYSVITEFIEGNIAHHPQKPRFPEMRRIWP